jgi:hypothetical protein
VLGVVLAALASVDARAEEETAVSTGVRDCRVMNEVADKEMAAFRKSQPPQPYPDPRPDLVLEAPWADVFRAFGKVPLELWLATLLPHAGVAARAGQPVFSLSWPWSFPLGPTMTCSRRAGSILVQNHKPLRLVLEPGMFYGDRLFTFWMRPGARFIYQGSDWVVGTGGGLGSTLDIVSRQEGFRGSLSPEALLRFGKCCDPGYFLLSARLDIYFTGTTTLQPTATFGFTYF